MELHGMPHDVRHLVVPSVVHPLHGMENTPLYRLQTVLDVRYGPFEDYVAGIVQKPVLVHPGEMMHGRGIKPVGRLVI